MNKICTSLEQSKKLIELGIDVNTADMYWWPTSLRYYIEAMDDGDFDETEGHIPAWSLSALMELIPSNVFLYSRLVKWDESYYIETREMLYDNPVDAAFEMIVWLLENKKI